MVRLVEVPQAEGWGGMRWTRRPRYMLTKRMSHEPPFRDACAFASIRVGSQHPGSRGRRMRCAGVLRQQLLKCEAVGGGGNGDDETGRGLECCWPGTPHKNRLVALPATAGDTES